MVKSSLLLIFARLSPIRACSEALTEGPWRSKVLLKLALRELQIRLDAVEEQNQSGQGHRIRHSRCRTIIKKLADVYVNIIGTVTIDLY